MEAEYRKHLEEILRFANEIRKTPNEVIRKIPLYSKQIADLRIRFVKSLAEEKLSLVEAQRVDVILTTTSDALLDYVRYGYGLGLEHMEKEID